MEWVEKLDQAGSLKWLQVWRWATLRFRPGQLACVATNRKLTPDSIPDTADQAAQTCFEILRRREQEQMKRNPLSKNSTANSGASGVSLFRTAARIRQGSALFKHLVVERWPQPANSTTAPAQSLPKLRSKSPHRHQTLPLHRGKLSSCRAQSLEQRPQGDPGPLGEVHDLDVLWANCVSASFSRCRFARPWRDRILSERSKRHRGYRKKMMGEKSLWQVWRAGLPQGKQIEVLATRRMKLWANGLDPDFPHSRARRQLALQLYDAFSPGMASLPSPSRCPLQSARRRASPRCPQIRRPKRDITRLSSTDSRPRNP